MSNPKLSVLQANSSQSVLISELATRAEEKSALVAQQALLMQQLRNELVQTALSLAGQAESTDSATFLKNSRGAITASVRALTNGHSMFSSAEENKAKGTSPGLSLSR